MKFPPPDSIVRDPNWLAVSVMLGGLPAAELLDFCYVETPQMPAGQVLAVMLAVIWYLAQQKRYGLPLLWFLGSFLWISTLLVLRHQLFGNLMVFLEAVVFMSAILVLIKYMRLYAPHYDKFLALGCAFLVPTLTVPVIHDMLQNAIYQLPVLYDRVLFHFDTDLGLGWVAVFAMIVNYSSWSTPFFIFNYNILPFWTLIAAVSEIFYAPRGSNTILLATMCSGYAGYLLYFLMPAIAPAPFFGALFPAHMPDPGSVLNAPIVDTVVSLRNTMPSLHAASAMLICLALRSSPIWHRALGGLILLSTLVSTLGLGQHYAVDWVAALPLVLWARGVSTIWLPLRQAARCDAIITGITLTAGWVLVVRYGQFGLDNAWIIRALALVSVAVPLLLERRLHRAAIKAPPSHMALQRPPRLQAPSA